MTAPKWGRCACNPVEHPCVLVERDDVDLETLAVKTAVRVLQPGAAPSLEIYRALQAVQKRRKRVHDHAFSNVGCPPDCDSCHVMVHGIECRWGRSDHEEEA